ncbi:MAG: metal-sensing transcriptional repressor [Ruminococcaceae bacterium]|nr:metal-sensing transcriptional repressor [Oscillospiraceae bacterium]
MPCQYCHPSKERGQDEKKALIHRLNRIEGQLRGIGRMVEEDAYCVDVLMQVSAVTAALNAFSKELLAAHIRTCVANDIRDGQEASTEELIAVLQKLMK